MGEAKRRKDTNQPAAGANRIVSWLPLTAAQSEQFVQASTKGAWIGIGILFFGWVSVRWIGPALGLWQTVG
jgi:Protein of unknown function (DUF2839)